MSKKIIKSLISVVITLLLLRAMWNIWSEGDIAEGFRKIDLSLFAVAAGCYVITYPVRSFRIYYMMRDSASFKRVLPVCMKHQFFGRIIPFKAGELSLVYLLKKSFGSSAAKGGTVLVLLRLFDAAVMVLSFIICNRFANVGGWLSYLAVGLFVFVIVFIIVMLFAFPKIIGFLKSVGKEKAAEKAEDVAELLKSISPKDFAVVFISTVVLWIFVYLSMHFVAAAFFPGLTVMKTVSASFLASVAAFLPVNGLGGFGTTEAGWTLGFSLMGMPESIALTSGVISNLMSFVITVCFGLISFLAGGDKNVQNNHNKQ